MSQETLFPEISNRMSNLVYNIKEHYGTDTSSPLTQILLLGTVKLHGTHADIIVHADNSISFQSRTNRNLTPEKDNYGFASFANLRKSSILALKERYHALYRSTEPNVPIDPSHPLILAGEWVGPGIQKGVGISFLPTKVFVICCVSINGTWVPNDGDYGNIHAEHDLIYNISRGGFYYHTLPLENTASSVREFQFIADDIEARCPFAESLGIIGGGEGLVYRVAPAFPQHEDLFLKVKGPRHAMRGTPKTPKYGPSANERWKAVQVAEEVASENRLEQGWDILREMNLKRSPTNLNDFVGWVVEDVEKEERKEIESEGVGWDLVEKEVKKRTQSWYIRKVMGEEDERDIQKIEMAQASKKNDGTGTGTSKGKGKAKEGTTEPSEISQKPSEKKGRLWIV